MRKATTQRDREIFTVLRFARGVPTAELARKSKLSHATVAKLRRSTADGGTRFPRNATLDAIAKACGKKRVWVDRDEARTYQPAWAATARH